MVTKEDWRLEAAPQSNSIYSAPVTPTEAAHKDMSGSYEKVYPDGEGSDDANNGFFEKIRSMLVSCGAVDVASFLMQNSCRGEGSAAKDETEQPTIMRMNMRKPSPAPNQRPKRRQGATLEFPSQGGFDDDVSAISAHTLEEMERFELLKNAKLLLAPVGAPVAPSSAFIKPMVSSKSKKRASPTTQKNLDWTYQIPRASSNTSISLGVSTSGSASSGEHDDEPGRLSTRRSEHHEMKISTRVEV
jgi:hypothetical protein